VRAALWAMCRTSQRILHQALGFCKKWRHAIIRGFLLCRSIITARPYVMVFNLQRNKYYHDAKSVFAQTQGDSNVNVNIIASKNVFEWFGHDCLFGCFVSKTN
jgi:hypothetical protein